MDLTLPLASCKRALPLGAFPETHMNPSIAVVGSINNIDLVIQTPRRPGRGESVEGGTPTWLPGGKGANQAIAAARLGEDV